MDTQTRQLVQRMQAMDTRACDDDPSMKAMDVIKRPWPRRTEAMDIRIDPR